MAQIVKRKRADGTDVYRVRIRGGAHEKSGTFTSFKLAKQFARKMDAEISDARHFPKEKNREKKFSDLVVHYIDKVLPKKPKSLKQQSFQLHWWEKYLGKYLLCHITPSMIAEIRDNHLLTETTYRGKKRAESTSNRFLAVLSHAFTYAVKEWRWVEENPVISVRRYKEARGRDRFLDKDEIAQLLAECRKSPSHYIYAFVLFALATGARRGEILNLRWEDIDLVRGTATFRDTKNGDTRTISLSNTIIDLLRGEKSKRVILSPFVFPSKDGKKPADIRTVWDAIIQRLGFKNVTIHTLRHTAASHLAMSGASTLEIAAILGHKTLAMVKRYSHLSVSATARAMDRMNREIFGDFAYG